MVTMVMVQENGGNGDNDDDGDNGDMVTMEDNVDMEDTYLPAGIYAGCAGDMNSSQGEGSSW